MDIKNMLNSILPLNLRPKTGVDKTIKMGNTTDRDANGQQQYQNQDQKPKDPMTEEQLQKALEILKSYPAVKEHHLTAELIEHEGKRFVLLKEPDGKLVRRIAEAELWTLSEFKNWESSQKGQLLRKTA